MMRTVHLLLMSIALTAPSAIAADLGVVGQTYQIAEPDMMEALKEAAAKVDWPRYLTKEAWERKFREYRPQDLAGRLPRAEKDSVFQVDLTYVNEFDIPDGKGGILYPKGYTFNPLDYLPTYPFTLVLIDAADRQQVEWFQRSAYRKDLRTKLLLVDGSYFDLAKELKRPVYYATTPIIARFNVKRLPSVIRQNGRFMEVREVLIAKN